MSGEDASTTGRYDQNCSRCESLRLDTIFSDISIRKHRWGHKVATITILDDACNSACAFCRILHRTRYDGPGPLASRQDRCFTIWACSYLRQYEISRYDHGAPSYHDRDTICLLVLAQGVTLSRIHFASDIWKSHPPPECILQEQCSSRSPWLSLTSSTPWKTTSESREHSKDREPLGVEGAVVPEHVNLEYMGTKIRETGETDRPPKPQESRRVDNVMLIDCRTRLISIWQPSMPYVALSYVWGQDTVPLCDWKPVVGTPLPRRLPRTIEDAIEVTTGLGFTWLWVDQVCIDQDDDTHKAAQIAAMDLIYKNAIVTIVAAVGDHADHGLPGAPSRKRTQTQQYAYAMISGLTLVPSLTRPEWLIEKSAWAGRAWTYQEGLLSNRRLVFTPEQLYLEGDFQNVYNLEFESVRFPCATGLLRGLRVGYFKGGCRGKPPHRMGRPGTDRDNVFDHLDVYLQRRLTHEADLLSAYTGIISHFGKISRWGLPVDIDPVQQNGKSSQMALHDEFVRLLAWRHSDAAKSRRRTGFPSFSWTGWYGSPVLPGSRMLPLALSPDVELKIKIISPDVGNLEVTGPASLCIEAEVIRLTCQRRSHRDWHWRPVDEPYRSKLDQRHFDPQFPVVPDVETLEIECIRVVMNDDPLLDSYVHPNGYYVVIERYPDHIERRGWLGVKGEYHDWMKSLPFIREQLTLR